MRSLSAASAPQADIWTLGCVLYYLLSDGEMPFEACEG
jgi:serine/threonine protein kinase